MHIYLDNNYYFITCRTKDLKDYFSSEQAKILILEKFYLVKVKFNLNELIYAILNNHYHFLTYIRNGLDLPKIMQVINGLISKELNLNLNHRLWDIYFDKFIVSENDYLKVIGYIKGNPLKHNLVMHLDDLKDYRFCSYNEIAKKYGHQGAIELITKIKNLNWE